MKDLELYNLQKFYANFNDLSRLKIILYLIDKTLTIDEICEMSDLTPIPVGLQLEFLKKCNIVIFEEKNDKKYYTLNERINKRIKSDIKYLKKEGRNYEKQ